MSWSSLDLQKASQKCFFFMKLIYVEPFYFFWPLICMFWSMANLVTEMHAAFSRTFLICADVKSDDCSWTGSLQIFGNREEQISFQVIDEYREVSCFPSYTVVATWIIFSMAWHAKVPNILRHLLLLGRKRKKENRKRKLLFVVRTDLGLLPILRVDRSLLS